MHHLAVGRWNGYLLIQEHYGNGINDPFTSFYRLISEPAPIPIAEPRQDMIGTLNLMIDAELLLTLLLVVTLAVACRLAAQRGVLHPATRRVREVGSDEDVPVRAGNRGPLRLYHSAVWAADRAARDRARKGLRRSEFAMRQYQALDTPDFEVAPEIVLMIRSSELRHRLQDHGLFTV